MNHLPNGLHAYARFKSIKKMLTTYSYVKLAKGYILGFYLTV